MEILNVQHLCKTYGSGETRVEALKDVSFTLQKGEFAAVVGESGSGKSTLLKVILSLPGPDAAVRGSVRLAGQELTALPAAALRRLRGALARRGFGMDIVAGVSTEALGALEDDPVDFG